jgi:hypothetical protein
VSPHAARHGEAEARSPLKCRTATAAPERSAASPSLQPPAPKIAPRTARAIFAIFGAFGNLRPGCVQMGLRGRRPPSHGSYGRSWHLRRAAGWSGSLLQQSPLATLARTGQRQVASGPFTPSQLRLGHLQRPQQSPGLASRRRVKAFGTNKADEPLGLSRGSAGYGNTAAKACCPVPSELVWWSGGFGTPSRGRHSRALTELVSVERRTHSST